jgi:hypothetical protein
MPGWVALQPLFKPGMGNRRPGICLAWMTNSDINHDEKHFLPDLLHIMVVTNQEKQIYGNGKI